MLKFHYQSRKLLFLIQADVSILGVLINEYQTVHCDPNICDVASVFSFSKVEQHPKCLD